MGGRDIQTFRKWFHTRVSIHAPRGGRDAKIGKLHTARMRFQSTRPVGGATPAIPVDYELFAVSIHAPRGGRDTVVSVQMALVSGFNPRAPWGARRWQSSAE